MRSRTRQARSFVVYTDKVGRTEKGIYTRHVRIVGDTAFVLPEGSAKQADMLPAANVFHDRDAAEAYLGGTGVQRWVVGDDERTGVPKLLEARVVYGVAREHYSGGRSYHCVIVTKSGKTLRRVEYHDVHETKEAAEAAFLVAWTAAHDEAKKALAKTSRLLAELARSKPGRRR